MQMRFQALLATVTVVASIAVAAAAVSATGNPATGPVKGDRLDFVPTETAAVETISPEPGLTIISRTP